MVRKLFVLAMMAFGSPALAQQATPAPAAVPAPEKKVCKSIVPTGSIMARRFCLTPAEWKQLDDTHDRGSAEAFRNKRSIGCGKQGGVMGC